MINRSYIDNGASGQIHLARSSSSTPRVLLLHQTPRSWDEYREVMELLEEKFSLVAMDLPGMGASSSVGREPMIEDYSRAAIRVVEKLVNEPLIVCGHHTGGVVAMDMAAKRPDLVQSLVLSSTPWIDEKARERRAGKTSIDSVSPSPSGDHLVDLWQQRRPYYPENIDYLSRFLASALAAENPEHGHKAVSQYKMELTAPEIKCPVLLVEHSKDPFAVKSTAQLKRAFPQAAIEQIADGMVPLEVTASKFAEILSSWVSRQPITRIQT